MNEPADDEGLPTSHELPPLTPLPRSVGKLLMAAEAIRTDPMSTELAFMARALVQATLPHSDPGEVPVWGRSNGNLTLSIKPDWEIDPKTNKPRCVGVPYGTIPRLLLFWITTEAVRTKQRRLVLGPSLSSFMRELDLIPTGGRWGTIPRLRDQMKRLFRAKISFDVNMTAGPAQGQAWLDMQVAPQGELWWSHQAPNQETLWQSWIELGEKFFEAICAAPVPIDMRALRALKRSPLALDLYAWANYRSFTVAGKGAKQFIPWRGLAQQMGADYGDIADFRKKAKGAMQKVLAVSPNLDIEYVDGGMVMHPSKPAIAPRRSKRLEDKAVK